MRTIRRSPSRFLGQEAKAIGVDGKTVLLQCCRCGHVMRETLPSETGAQKMAHYWRGGLASFCPRCDDKSGRPKAG